MIAEFVDDYFDCKRFTGLIHVHVPVMRSRKTIQSTHRDLNKIKVIE